jgi:hypothetical protein
MMKKGTKKNTFKENDYKIIRKLYYLNKGENKVARLPINDTRRVKLIKTNNQVGISFRKALSRIAAMW